MDVESAGNSGVGSGKCLNQRRCRGEVLRKDVGDRGLVVWQVEVELGVARRRDWHGNQTAVALCLASLGERQDGNILEAGQAAEERDRQCRCARGKHRGEGEGPHCCCFLEEVNQQRDAGGCCRGSCRLRRLEREGNRFERLKTD